MKHSLKSCKSAKALECIAVFFFNDTATTEIYTLSLHDALPIFINHLPFDPPEDENARSKVRNTLRDRKSTRLNSSHSQISYAVFCLKKNNKAHVTVQLVGQTLITLSQTRLVTITAMHCYPDACG